jgi:glucokinase
LNLATYTDHVIAVDMGGTKLRLAMISRNGAIVAFSSFKTEAYRGVDNVISRLTQAVRGIVDKTQVGMKGISGISLAIAGGIDIYRGLVTASPHLPGWSNVPLRSIIEESLGKRARLVNDANAAALGEYLYGRGKGIINLIYLTVSTGIGGGIIINGHLYEGLNGVAGEIGHMIIKDGGAKCSCGSNGCFEAMVSGTAMVREAEASIKGYEYTSLKDIHKKNNGQITAKDIAQAARTGDRIAQKIVQNAAYYLGVGLTNIVNIFNPEMIVIGGGLSKMGNLLLGPAREVVKARAFTAAANNVKIVKSNLGDRAGLLGAAILFFIEVG